MKTRRVVLTIEVDTAAPLSELRRADKVSLWPAHRAMAIDAPYVVQIQANVIRETKKPKPFKRGEGCTDCDRQQKPARRKGRKS